MRDGNLEGMQIFDDVIERLVREGTITIHDGLAYASNRQNLLLQLSDFAGGLEDLMESESPSMSELIS